MLMQRATYTTQFTQLALQSACEDRHLYKAYEQDATDYGTYDLCVPVRNAFDAGKSITRARGLGPGNQDFCWAL